MFHMNLDDTMTGLPCLSDEERSRAAYLYRRLAYGIITDSELDELLDYIENSITCILAFRTHPYEGQLEDFCNEYISGEGDYSWFIDNGWCKDIPSCEEKSRKSCELLNKLEQIPSPREKFDYFIDYWLNELHKEIDKHDVYFLRCYDMLRSAKTRRDKIIAIDTCVSTVHYDITTAETLFPEGFIEELDWLRERRW